MYYLHGLGKSIKVKIRIQTTQGSNSDSKHAQIAQSNFHKYYLK